MMEYTSSVTIEVVQKNGETVYSDFNVKVNGMSYQEKDDEEKDEMDRLAEELYEEVKQVYKKWKKKRVR